MSKTRAQKEEQVIKFTEAIKGSKSVVFVDYKGLTMGQLSDLRAKLSEQGATLTVTKNTLMERALPTSNLPLPTSILKGPTATLFSQDDEVAPIKTLVKTLKDTQIGEIKGGFLGPNFLDKFSITRLANLPGKQELRGQVVGILASPLQGIVGVLQANLRNLVYALDQIRIQKGGE